MTTTAAALRDHLTSSRLAGNVATPPTSTRTNCGKLAAGEPEYTFGLSDWQRATADDAVDAVAALCGPAAVEGDRGWIDPDACLAGIERHRQVLADAARDGARVLAATGHPTGLLGHYGAIARALRAAGCEIVRPLDDRDVPGHHRLRFVDGVACACTGGDLVHTHRSVYAEAMLSALPAPPDVVVGDHGMAGAAIERGIPAVSIADVNDPALPLAQARGRTDAVLPIDDNLAPVRYEPVTAAVVDAIRAARFRAHARP